MYPNVILTNFYSKQITLKITGFFEFPKFSPPGAGPSSSRVTSSSVVLRSLLDRYEVFAGASRGRIEAKQQARGHHIMRGVCRNITYCRHEPGT